MLKSFGMVFKNKQYVIFSLGDLFVGVSMAFFQTAMLYYITMLLNVPESQSFLVMLCAIAVAICLFPLIIKISRKYNKKIPLVIAAVVFTAVFGLIYFGDKIAALAPGKELFVGLGMGGHAPCDYETLFRMQIERSAPGTSKDGNVPK